VRGFFSSVKGKESFVRANLSVEWLLVNLPAVSNRNQIQLIPFHVEFVNNPVIADAQPKSVHPLQSLMRKPAKISA
jgi:hypothetical protein